MSRRDTLLVNKTLYQISVMTVIAAVCWVGITVYLALAKQPDVNVDKAVLLPISPAIDQDTITSLSGRLTIQQDVPQNASISGDGVQ